MSVETLVNALIVNAQLGLSGVFLALFLLIFWQHRADTKVHRDEFRAALDKMFEVVDKNTEANAKLTSAVDNLKDHINRS